MKKSIKLTIIYLSLISILLSSCSDGNGTKVIEHQGPMQNSNMPQSDPLNQDAGKDRQEVGDPAKKGENEPSQPEGSGPASQDEKPEADGPASPESSEKQPEEGQTGEQSGIKPGVSENQAPTKEENPQTEQITDENDYFNGFFSTSLFIGDSRSDGLMRYGHIGYPTKFCHTGLSVYNYDDEDLEVEGFGKTSLEALLENGCFDRIYIGLGINELGYGQETTMTKFSELLDIVKANQPQATIYMLANLHVAGARSKKDKIHNNANINSLNERISGLCDGTKIIYLDANPLFDDENGDLKKDYTGDNTHLRARCYPSWAQFIYDNSI